MTDTDPDQRQAPLLDGLVDYRRHSRYGFSPPGHRQGRGVDPRVLDVLGVEPFRDDVLASSGLDDRSSSQGYLSRAEDLMAAAVGADTAFFSTCGSSLSVKAAMLAVAGREGAGGGALTGEQVAGRAVSGRWPAAGGRRRAAGSPTR